MTKLKNHGTSNKKNILHYQKVVREYILSGKPIYTKPNKGKKKEKLVLDKEEREHPETEFQSIYKKGDPIREQFKDARNYFLSLHGKRGHLIRVETTAKGDYVYWEKEDTSTKRAKYHIPYDKDNDGRTEPQSIATYDLIAFVYGKINAFGIAEDMLKDNLYNAIGTSIEDVQGSHIDKYDPEQPDDPNGIQFITTTLHKFIQFPKQLDATDEEIVNDSFKFSEEIKEEFPEDNSIKGLKMQYDKEKNQIIPNKGEYITINAKGEAVFAFRIDEEGNIYFINDLRSCYTNFPELDSVIDSMESFQYKVVHINTLTEEEVTIVIFKIVFGE